MSRSPTVADRSDPESGTSLVPRLPGWTGRSGVEQVDLYTRGSLYSVAWFLIAMAVLGASAQLRSTQSVLVLLAVATTAGVVVTLVSRRALAGDRSPSWLLLGASVLIGVGLALWGRTLDGEPAASIAIIGAGTLGWAAGGLTDRRLQGAAYALAGLCGWFATGLVAVGLACVFLALFFGFTVVSSLWLLGVVTELDRARGAQAALAVAEERLRFSRDVHDVLGRQLSVIAVQAELAATLARRGDERAEEKVLQVRATAHDALREARELARGYRPLDLGQELDGAVSLLRSAGIEARADLSGLPEAWHEPVARVVREAVTNVLRHSDARTVELSYADRTVVVADDGGASGPGAGDGSGLESLRQDLAPLGARLEAGPGATGFEVRLALGGTAPRTPEVER